MNLTVGKPYQVWCDEHQEYHFEAAIYYIAEDGPRQIATYCSAHAENADDPTEEAVSAIWDDAAIAKSDLIDGAWLWWEDLDEDTRNAARPRITAFLRQLMDDIPAEEDADD